MEVAREAARAESWRQVRRVAHVEREFDRIRSYLAINPAAVVGDRPAGLHVRWLGLDVSRDVRVVLGDLEIGGHAVRVPLQWSDARRPKLFPAFEGTLEITADMIDGRPVSRLDLAGRYRPPFGRLGTIVSALAGHRLLVESVDLFLARLGKRLKEELP